MNVSRNDLVAVRDAAQGLVDALDGLLCPEPDPEPFHSGAGLFVRTLKQYPDYADKHLSWISVCVLGGGRARARDAEWWEARREAGVGLSAWDWFPDPDDPTKGLEDAVSFAADNGCKSFIMNAEKAFRKRPRAAEIYASKARALCDENGGLSLGLVSYSVPSTIRDFPWAEFARYCDFGVPEIYDRDHRLDPAYPPRALGSWREAGFESLIPACGIYYRDDRWNWRTPDMVRDHLALFPGDTGAWIAWPLGGKPPEATLEALSRGSGTRPGTTSA